MNYVNNASENGLSTFRKPLPNLMLTWKAIELPTKNKIRWN